MVVVVWASKVVDVKVLLAGGIVSTRVGRSAVRLQLAQMNGIGDWCRMGASLENTLVAPRTACVALRRIMCDI